MKAALFFENNHLCHLCENIKEKAITVSTITTQDDKVISIKNSNISHRNLNYFIQWLIDCGVKMIYVSGIDEQAKLFFEQMKIIVNIKKHTNNTRLLAEITAQK